MVQITLNRNFYNKKTIQEAIRDFSDVCTAKIINDNYDVEIEQKENIDNLPQEFSNYVLGLMKNEAMDSTETTEEKKKNHVQNHFRVKRFNDSYLITNDSGDWLFLDTNEYKLFSQDKAQEDPELLQKLKDNNFLIDENNFEKAVQKYKCKKSFLDQGPSLHIITLTLRCNIKCVYCHASSKPQNKYEYDMTKENAKKVVDLIMQSPSPSVMIEFQGGEPLLNFDVLKYITKYATEQNELYKKNLKFSVVTNLDAMDEEKLDFLAKNKIAICTSLDGPEKLHNKTRQKYDSVVSWIKRINEEHNKGNIEAKTNALLTVSRHHLDSPKEIVDEYLRLGLHRIHVRGINQLGDARDKAKEIYYPIEDFIEFWKKCLDYIIEINKNGKFFKERKTTIILKKLLNDEDPNYADLRSPCGAVIGQILYNYDGSIYTCDEGRMLGEDDLFQIGNTSDSYKEITTNKTSCAIIAASTNDVQYCDKCVYKPFCGICPVLNYASAGSLMCNIPNSDWCKLHMAQFDYVLDKLQNDSDAKKVFLSWINKSKEK